MKPSLLLFGFFFLVLAAQAKNNTSPYAFIENKGQIIDQNNNLNPAVKYLWTGNGMKVQLKANSFSYEVLKADHYKRQKPLAPAQTKSKSQQSALDDSMIISSHRVDVELLGANPNPEIITGTAVKEYLNYYTTGTPEEGVKEVHQYNKVTYQNIYPNIDLEFMVDGSNTQPFKYNFIVKPGGRVADIQLRYNGANAVELNPQGSINITTAYSSFEESIPRSYVAETGKDITVNYQQSREDVFGFSAGNYSANQTLVIDPWCTYFGWNGSLSQGQIGSSNLVTDNTNNIYVVGTTDIGTNIASSGAYQTIYGGGTSDAFIRKFSSNGLPVWCTYYGGNSIDEGADIDCDEFGNLYITGPTWSSNNIATSGTLFPTLPVTSFTSFLSKFNTNGVRQWGTYYPGASISVKTDHSGNVIIGGNSEDTNAVTQGAHQTIPGGNGDDFIAKFTSTGTRLWGTFYGGSELENSTIDLSIDGQNNIFLSGTTASSNNISTPSSFQQPFGGVSDNFIVKFNSSGVRQWGTYYGGTGDEGHTTYIATNINGDIYFVGEAASIGVFATVGAFQTNLGGFLDYCLAKFNTNGQRIWGTYFGGSDDDQILSLKIDSHGNPIFGGSTLSTNIIGTAGTIQPNFTVGATGWADDFIEKFNPLGSRIWGTYFGGIGNEPGIGLAIDNENNIIISGVTNSKGLATIGAFQTTLIDTVNGDIFLASLDSNGTFTTGIGEINPQPSLIKVYPNPTKDKITITLQESNIAKGTITVVDVMGKVVKSVSCKDATSTPLSDHTSAPLSGRSLTLDIKDLPVGVYMVQYDDGEVCEAVKIIKQ